MKEPTQFSQLQMTMRDTWVNHHLVIWKIRRERMLVDQVVLEAVAVTQARPLVVNAMFSSHPVEPSRHGTD